METLNNKQLELINGGDVPCWGPSGVLAGFVLGLGILTAGVMTVVAVALIAGQCAYQHDL